MTTTTVVAQGTTRQRGPKAQLTQLLLSRTHLQVRFCLDVPRWGFMRLLALLEICLLSFAS